MPTESALDNSEWFLMISSNSKAGHAVLNALLKD